MYANKPNSVEQWKQRGPAGVYRWTKKILTPSRVYRWLCPYVPAWPHAWSGQALHAGMDLCASSGQQPRQGSLMRWHKGFLSFCLGQRGSEWGLAGKDHRRRTEFAAMQRRMHLLSGHNFKRKKKNKITKTTTKKTQLFLTLDQLSSAWGGHLGNEPEEDLCLSFSFYSTFEMIQNKCILKRPLSFVIEPRAKQATPGWSSLFPNENPSQAAGVGMWRAQNWAVHLQHLSCLLHAGGMITLYILPCTKPTYAGDRNPEDSTLLFRTQECKLCSHALNHKKIMLSCSSKQNPT